MPKPRAKDVLTTLSEYIEAKISNAHPDSRIEDSMSLYMAKDEMLAVLKQVLGEE